MSASPLRRLLVDSPRSLGAQARLKRWQEFQTAFPGIDEMRVLDLGGTVDSWMRVLDLGGTVDSWMRSPVRPRHITVINLDDRSLCAADNIVGLEGDACKSSAVLSQFNVDPNFDLVFSNSLIEHVGGHARRCELAAEVRKLAPRHWIQTPNRYFPLEPHWLFPGMQFLPAAARVKIARHWPLVDRPASPRAATVHVLGTELVSRIEMSFYFPDSKIWHERVLGVTKSLVAVKN